MTIHDTGLIDALRQGQSDAFTVIYRHFIGPVCFFVEELVTDRQVAEDITTEAFVKAFHKHTDFETLDKLKAFLYVSAANRAKDHLRDQKRHERVHNAISYISEGHMEDAELAYMKAEAVKTLRDEMDKLPTQCSQVIKLSFIDGKSITEIAEQLGISYRTVQNHKARGIQLLRSSLIQNKLLSTVALLIALGILDRQ